MDDNKLEIVEMAAENANEGFLDSKVAAGALGFGGGLVAGILLEKFVIKPLIVKIKNKKEAKKAEKNDKKEEA